MCRKVTIKQYLHAAGQIVRLSGNKQGRQSVIVDRIGYDKEGHTVYTKLGNGTETTYTYDKQRERLQVMNLTADGQTVILAEILIPKGAIMMKGTAKSQGGQWIGGRTQYFTVGNLNRVKQKSNEKKYCICGNGKSLEIPIFL